MFKDYFHSKKAVLLDLDGTVIDSHLIWNEACKEVASNLGFEWRGYNFFTEPSLEKVWRSYLSATREDYGVPISSLVSQTKDKYLTNLLSLSQEDLLKPGFWPFINEIKTMKEMKVGLVTNSDRDITDRILKHLNVEKVFDVVICGDEVKNKKPDPEIYEKAIKSLGLKAKDILCFEDAPIGVKSARSSGLEVIGVRNKLYSEREYPSDLTFVLDFTVFPGNLDRYHKEILAEHIARIPEETPANKSE